MSQEVTLTRTLQVLAVQTWTVQIPDGYDMEEWLANDEHGFHDYLIANGELDREEFESLLADPEPSIDDWTVREVQDG